MMTSYLHDDVGDGENDVGLEERRLLVLAGLLARVARRHLHAPLDGVQRQASA